MQVEGWGGGNFVCDKCDLRFEHRIKYIDHMRGKHKEKTIKCPSCTDMFSETNKLKHHMRVNNLTNYKARLIV